MPLPTPAESLRLACRTNTHTTSTSLLTPTIQANLLVLPSRHAASFRALCARNPVSCPLLWTTPPGAPTTPLAPTADLRTDLPKYNIYLDGILQTPEGVLDIKNEWSPDHVGFLIGCSFSFETALERAGLPPRHTLCTPPRTVPMFRTTVPLCPAGVFTGGVMVVSMRSYPPGRVEEVRDITRRFGRQHGEPVAWGWEGAETLGVAEKMREGRVDFGEWVEVGEGEVPVFWGCGVTPQVAVMESGIGGVVLSHFPGCMFVSDVLAEDEAELESVVKALDVVEEVGSGGAD
ncbi:DUF1445-domain-containing protein [Morchella conica CCBAS932]|uniref:DUF1445-domain-containing protein n=1 Tax=Morchella conica CCBAS932 TaxID=1392247 RepID=A0A3N4KHH2_9PEZI|nr:DUF1445-domain-containing protein [Morchella conica CCBAS932]